MATMDVNGVRLSYAISGRGEHPLVLVHGSWLNRRTWDSVVPHLADSFRVFTYDRRGHGESERPTGQGSIREDVADLAALIEQLGIAPAWVTGQSFGASITLRLAGERPDLFRGIIAHEPPLFSLLADDPTLAPMLEGFAQLQAAVAERIASGDHAGAAEQFSEEALGAGRWNLFSPEERQMMIEEAPTFLDEANDPDQITFDLARIRGFTRPALLTLGDQTAPVFPPVITKLDDALPFAEVRTMTGAGHPIHLDRPEDWADAITAFVRRHTASSGPGIREDVRHRT
jgi:pimeloyl-ACP methyl ester carboxylesterase